MTRRETVARGGVVALAAAGGVTLLWSAWRVLTAPLPDAAATAAWTLWVLAVAALVTFVLYLLELVRHGLSSGGTGWKPLPSLALLWVAGLTAVLAFGFVLPNRPGESTQPDVDSAPSPSATATSTPTPSTQATKSASPRPDARRSQPAAVPVRATSRPQPVSTPSVVRTTRTATPAPSTTSVRPAPTPTSTTTTRPLLDITLPPQGRRPTAPPPSR